MFVSKDFIMIKSKNSLIFLIFAVYSIFSTLSLYSANRMDRSDIETKTVSGRYDKSYPIEYKKVGWIFGRPSEESSSEQFKRAQDLEKAGKIKSACRAFNALVCKWGSSVEAAEAQYNVARLTEERGKYLQAFREYQYFLDYYNVEMLNNKVSFLNILERQYAVANALRANIGKGFLGIGDVGVDTVASMYTKIAANAGTWDKSSMCLLMCGACYEADKNYVKAIFEYENLISTYPQSKETEEALYRIAICRYKLSQRYHRDERMLKNTIVAMDMALERAPHHEYAEATRAYRGEVYDILTDLVFKKASFYDNIRHNDKASLIAYKDFLKQYPNSKESEVAKKRIAELELRVK